MVEHLRVKRLTTGQENRTTDLDKVFLISSFKRGTTGPDRILIVGTQS